VKPPLLALLPALLAAPQALPPAFPDDLPRGPVEIRDAQLLAQPRLTLPAMSPQTVRQGAWELQASSLLSNSFSWTQDGPGEKPTDRSFLIDGESLLIDLHVRRGLGPNLDVGIRLPFQGRGGGTLDGFIDWWHRLAHTPDGDRPLFLRNAFRVEGITTDREVFSWNDLSGSGLGDVELEARYRIRHGSSRSPSAALVGRIALPTSTGPFQGGGGLGGGGQLVAQFPLSDSFALYAGLGFTAQDPGPVRRVEYVPLRADGFVALEWRAARRLSLVAETNAASRLAENIDHYPGVHWIVNVTGRLDLGRRTRLDLGFTENIWSQLTTTDFALYVGLGFRP
jgi:hypothetical protein